MNIKKTNFDVDGMKVPCYEVTDNDGYAMVRIHPCYRIIGNNTTYATEYLDGEFNSREEYSYDFDMLTTYDIKRIVREQTCYIR